MIRYNIVQGDATTAGGRVVGAVDPCFSQDGKALAREGDLVWCPACGAQGRIVCVGPRQPSLVDGRQEALNGDLCVCRCKPSPLLIHSLTGMSHRMDGEGDAMFSPALAKVLHEAVALRPPPAPVSPPPTATPAPPVPTRRPAGPRAGITLRIGVLFDGSRNNAANTALGAQCRASTATAQGMDEVDQVALREHCRPYMTDSRSSYAGGATNVGRLFKLYPESLEDTGNLAPEGTASLKIYVDGIGTTAGKPDSSVGLALGVGASGVSRRVDDAFVQLLPNVIGDFNARYPDSLVEDIVFDVFGFSRGAAAARHFANQVQRKGQGPLSTALASVKRVPDFDERTSIRNGFVGLFDTVPSIGNLEDGFDLSDDRQGDLTLALTADIADKVVHLVARDERRANFNLMTVRPEHEEIALPGVHSDIGGGYVTGVEGPQYMTRPVGYDEPVYRIVGDLYRDSEANSRARKEAEAERERWQDLLGVPAHTLTIETWTHLHHVRRSRASVLKEVTPRVYATVVLTREMDHRYALIPLRLMYAKAIAAGVPLKPIAETEDLSLPVALQPIADTLLSGGELTTEQEARLRRKYLHQSAHWTPAMKHGVGPELIFINRPNPYYGRYTHANRDAR